MKHPLHRIRFACAAGLGIVAAVGWAAACSSEGTTSACPPLQVYDIKDAYADDGRARDTNAVNARKAAEAANCVTPIGYALGNVTVKDAGGN